MSEELKAERLYIIFIENNDKESAENWWLGMRSDGTIEHSDNINFDKPAKLFWESMQKHYGMIRENILEELRAEDQ